MSSELSNNQCVTCGEPLQETYCYKCGEKVFDRKELSLWNYSKEVAHQLTSLDAKIFKTIRLLVCRPGFLTKEYLMGRRTKYIRPMRLYLSFSMLYFFTFSYFSQAALIDIRNIERFDFTGKLAPAVAIKKAASTLPENAFFHAINQELNNKIALLLFLLIFAYALFFKILFWQKKKYFVEHLIFCLHLMSFSFFRDVLILPLYLHNKAGGFLFALLTTVVYLFMAVRQVYSVNVKKVALATVGLYGVFGAMLLCCAGLVIYQVLF